MRLVHRVGREGQEVRGIGRLKDVAEMVIGGGQASTGLLPM
jgi:hypothetical protein